MKKEKIAEILRDNGITAFPAPDDANRAFLLQTDTIHSDPLMKLIRAGVTTFTSINNDGDQEIILEY
jgi:hypothetical protein